MSEQKKGFLEKIADNLKEKVFPIGDKYFIYEGKVFYHPKTTTYIDDNSYFSIGKKVRDIERINNNLNSYFEKTDVDINMYVDQIGEYLIISPFASVANNNDDKGEKRKGEGSDFKNAIEKEGEKIFEIYYRGKPLHIYNENENNKLNSMSFYYLLFKYGLDKNKNIFIAPENSVYSLYIVFEDYIYGLMTMVDKNGNYYANIETIEKDSLISLIASCKIVKNNNKQYENIKDIDKDYETVKDIENCQMGEDEHYIELANKKERLNMLYNINDIYADNKSILSSYKLSIESNSQILKNKINSDESENDDDIYKQLLNEADFFLKGKTADESFLNLNNINNMERTKENSNQKRDEEVLEVYKMRPLQEIVYVGYLILFLALMAVSFDMIFAKEIIAFISQQTPKVILTSVFMALIFMYGAVSLFLGGANAVWNKLSGNYVELYNEDNSNEVIKGLKLSVSLTWFLIQIVLLILLAYVIGGIV